jgi:predicted DNA-binding protein (UPF0251 family)
VGDNKGAHRPTKEGSANLPTLNQTSEVSQAEAATIMGVSERTIRNARKVKKKGTDKMKQAVPEGKMPAR